MSSLDELKEIIKNKVEKENRVIRGIWSVDCLYNPAENGRVFDYKFIVAQTKGQGCAYSMQRDYDVEYLKSLVGKDFLDLEITDVALNVALMDSIFDGMDSAEVVKKIYDGASEEKLHWRSEMIVQEAIRLIGDLKHKKIVNVGVVGDIIKAFIQEGSEVCGTDFDEEVIGKVLFDKAVIYDGDETFEKIKESDLAIVTGMTIVTGTIDKIINTCIKHNTKLIVFAETGGNLGKYFIKKGVNCFIGETFPFYIFNGSSTICIYRDVNYQ